MTRILRLTVVLLLFVATIPACKKDAEVPEEKPLQVLEITSVNNNEKPGVIIPADKTLLPSNSEHNFNFDWETAEYMPTAPGASRVPVPWSEQVVRNYDPALRYDYRKAEGWELVYNSFSDSVNFADQRFILYNKFRGVLRSYSYNPRAMSPDLLRAKWFFNELSIEPGSFSSPLLNFAEQHIVDISADSRKISVIEPWRLDEDCWIITEFEMAYDESIGSKAPFPQAKFQWELVFTTMAEQTINNIPALGSQLYLQIPGVNFKNPSLYGALINGKVLIRKKAANNFGTLSGLLPASAFTELQQSISNNEPGRFLNASFTPSLGLAVTKVEVDGTLRIGDDQFIFASPNFALPGMNNSAVLDFGPIFNEPLGIFYLKQKPVIRHAQISGELREQYSLEVASVKYLLNPFVQDYAEIRGFQQEIVAVDTKDQKALSEAKIYRGQILRASAPLNILGVRVSFEVVPKNGSGSTKIIKTFKADVQN